MRTRSPVGRAARNMLGNGGDQLRKGSGMRAKQHPLVTEVLKMFGGTVIPTSYNSGVPSPDATPGTTDGHPEPEKAASHRDAAKGTRDASQQGSTTRFPEAEPQGFPAAVTPEQTPCDPAAILQELQGAARPKKTFWGPGDVLIALNQGGIETVVGRGIALTLLKLVSFPADRIYIRATKLAALGGLTPDMVRRHLAALRRPWRAPGQKGLLPPLFYVERRAAAAGQRAGVYLVPNEQGWRALFRVLFAESAARKQAAQDRADETRRRRQASAQRPRTSRVPPQKR